MDLTEFLAARLDEDQAVARKATDSPWHQDGMSIRGAGRPYAGGREDEVLVVRHTWPQESAHIVRHDPARVLREVAADRTLLCELQAAGKEVQGNDIGMAEPLTLRSRGYYAGLLRAAMIRATRFADHPDYRAEWKP